MKLEAQTENLDNANSRLRRNRTLWSNKLDKQATQTENIRANLEAQLARQKSKSEKRISKQKRRIQELRTFSTHKGRQATRARRIKKLERGRFTRDVWQSRIDKLQATAAQRKLSTV